MKDLTKPAIVLLISTFIASLALALIFKLTSPYIKASELKEEIEARTQALPDAKSFTPFISNNDTLFWIALSDNLENNGDTIGYITTAYGKGYSSIIKTIVGLDKQFKITGIKIVSIVETPGLGMKAIEPSFTDQYKGKDKIKIKVKNDGGTIDAIAGATITSRAISNSIISAIDSLQKSIEKR